MDLTLDAISRFTVVTLLLRLEVNTTSVRLFVVLLLAVAGGGWNCMRQNSTCTDSGTGSDSKGCPPQKEELEDCLERGPQGLSEPLPAWVSPAAVAGFAVGF